MRCYTCVIVAVCGILSQVAQASILSKLIQETKAWNVNKFSHLKERNTISKSKLHIDIRGGGHDEKTNEVNEQDPDQDCQDEERYSRQLYTLGARAHSLVRKSTIIIDGPTESGLLYEAVKNLALSGVGEIIILTNDDENINGSDDNEIDDICSSKVRQKEEQYFNSEMDDLGITYKRGARAECFPNDDEEEVCNLDLILEYCKRLNPSVKIQSVTRKDFVKFIDSEDKAGDENEMNEGKKFKWDNAVFLSVDRPETSQISCNKLCRRQSIAFVAIETAGCYGRVFCDFGDVFQVIDEDGEAPQSTLLQRVEKSELDDMKKAGDVIIHCVDGEHHDVSKGDIIQFLSNDGQIDLEATQCKVVFVQNPVCFTAKFCSEGSGREKNVEKVVNEINENVNTFVRLKQPKRITFASLADALENAENPQKDLFAASDLDKSFDLKRRKAIMRSFSSLEKFVKDKHRLPNPLDEECVEDSNIFSNLTESASDSSLNGFVESFVQTCRAKFVPLQAIYGALGAQEVLKAASGLYNPIKQFLLYDCDEILHGIESGERKNISSSSKAQAKGMKHILGKKTVRKLASEKIFVVGSGAIGCELLKNLAAMDAATQKKKGGSIILTDMDTIEKSNLSRQFLFRDADVGKFKSAAAEEAIQRLNSRVQMDTHTSKVGEESALKETYFDDNFWAEGVDVVMNALDNVEARLFMDSMCVANRKAMIDAGTLGAKGNVQVVVPCQSESYGSSADPPEPTIAVCTLKNFPYQISHTIQWGRDLFDGLFNRRPSQVNEYFHILSTTSVDAFSRSLLQKLGEDAAVESATELAEDLVVFNSNEKLDNVKEESIKWAVALSKRLFQSSIQKLLRQHPLDSVDEDGEYFWTGTRRAPSPLIYSKGDDISAEAQKINQNLINFVRYAARLRIETYLSNESDMRKYSEVSEEEAKNALQCQSQEETCIVNKENEAVKDRMNELLEEPKAAAQSFVDELNVESFEKDDEKNGHVSFVTAASNLRAIAYGILPVDEMETRRIAGRIVPAMISTTALVSAFSCIELIKLLQNAPLKSYRNAFVNLALPFFAFTAPLPAEKVCGLNGNVHTIWDRIIVKESEKARDKGGIKLRRLIRQIQKSSSDPNGIDVANISFGPYMLFANFLHADDDSVLDKPVIELITEAILSNDDDFDIDDDEDEQSIDMDTLTEVQKREVETLQSRTFVDFSVIVEDNETGEEAELPPVRLNFFPKDDSH